MNVELVRAIAALASKIAVLGPSATTSDLL
jgi:hypothetical protein